MFQLIRVDFLIFLNRVHHLLTFDSYETLNVLSVVFDDHTVPESVCQEIANVLIDLMLDLEQEPFAPHGGQQQLSSRSGFNLLEQEYLLTILGKYYAKGTISIGKPILLLIIGMTIIISRPNNGLRGHSKYNCALLIT